MSSSAEPEARRDPPGASSNLVYESAHDAALWATLASTTDSEEFAQSWLAIQCRLLPAVEGALVLLLSPAGDTFVPAAVWPDIRRDMSYLSSAAQRALEERRGLVQSGAETPDSGHHVAYPINVGGKVGGVVVLHVAARSEAELQGVLRQLHWGAAGLQLLLHRDATALEIAAKERMRGVLDLLAAAVAQPRFAGAALTLATELATRLGCERVCLGFLHHGQARVEAVSHSAQFRERTNLLRTVAAAMDESMDQGASVAWPALPGSTPVVSRAHEALARAQGDNVNLTVPLASKGQVVGAITLERAAGGVFTAADQMLLETLVGLAGPMLETQRRENKWFGARLAAWLRERAVDLAGPDHPGLKLLTLVIVGVFLLLALVRGEYRVAAPTTLEPRVQQAAVAPFNGYVREAPARAGDVVHKGQMLARLDDRELRLEHMKLASQAEEQSRQLRQAMAEHNSAMVQILGAQAEQARAQISRVEDQLEKTRLVAPFDGVVVSGDLSQSLGAPVERGTVLFEIAPVGSFRVVLKVDERDVEDLRLGQRGFLRLAAFPHDAVALEVEKLTAVSTPREGRNYFRIEARLDGATPQLRPGMEGVAKIAIDRRRYLWIWGHEVVDWARLALWKWLP